MSLLSVVGKLLANFMLKRLINNVSEDLLPNAQHGFRQDRSTEDMNFLDRQATETSKEQNRELHMSFIYLSKAFESVEGRMPLEITSKGLQEIISTATDL